MKSNEPAANNMVEEAELMFWIAEKLKNHNLWLHSRSRALPGRAVDVFLKTELKKKKRSQISENTRSRPPAERQKTEHVRLQL